MRKYLTLLLLMVSSVLLIRIGLDGPGLHYKFDQENFWLNKANTSRKQDFLILGDSRIYYAVNPALLTSQNALNFAFPSLSYTSTYLDAADKLLQEKASVLIGLTAESLTDYGGDKGFIAYQTVGPLFIAKFFKWMRIYWPQAGLQPWLKWGQSPWLLPRSKKGDDTYHSSGWIENESQASASTEGMIQHYRQLAGKFQINPKLVHHLSEKVAHWSRSGKKVYFFWACFEARVCQEEKDLLTSAWKNKIEQDLISRGGKQLLSEGSYETFDGDHLKSFAAHGFSSYLKSQLESDH